MCKGKIFLLFFSQVFIWLYAPASLRAQAFTVNDTMYQITLSGNQRFPSFSTDGRIVFQSDKNIYLYNPATDSIVVLPADTNNAQHPVWVPGKEAVVYDAGHGKESRLIYLNLRTGKTHLLLHREIACREASFTPSRHLVVFSGFDDRTQHWQIYSYDFIYDNLNRLTNEKGNCSFPVFSSDGKSIAFTVREDNGKLFLKTMNWYGDSIKSLAGGVTGRASWTPDNWRILYITKNGIEYILFGIRADGTGKEKILSVPYPICCPAFSKSGKQLLLSEKKSEQFQIVTVREKTGLQ